MLKYTIEELRETAWMTKRHNYQWYKLNNRNTIGDMMYLIAKFKPTSIQDLYDKYVTDGEISEETDRRHRGRTEDELYAIAEMYKEMCNDDIPIETYLKNVIWHTIVQSYDGYAKEMKLIDFIQGLGYKAVKADSDDDCELGIDLFIYKGDEMKYAIQLKPISFLIGNHNQSLKYDRQKAILNTDKVKNKYGVPTYFVFYRPDGTYLENGNGGITHKITDYSTKQGHSIYTY